MNQYMREDRSYKYKSSRRKSKRRARRRFMSLLILICCCFAVITVITSQSENKLFLNTGKKYDTSLSAIDTSIEEIVKTGPVINNINNINNNDESSWCLILVNKWNNIPEHYEVELTELSNGHAVDRRIYPALQEMFDTARKEGIYPIVVSGYRTTEKQQQLMDEKISEYMAQGYSVNQAKAKAESWVAIPGTSEHQIGLGVDINADGIHSIGEDVYEWLKHNGYKFGFIRRYPEDKTDITNVINEPWHYRYVGIKAATEMYNQNVCLEEYLEMMEREE